jgi:hypothetical protein
MRACSTPGKELAGPFRIYGAWRYGPGFPIVMAPKTMGILVLEDIVVLVYVLMLEAAALESDM